MAIPLLVISQLLLSAVQIIAVALVTFACAHFPFFKGLRVASFGVSLSLAILIAIIYTMLNVYASVLNWATLGMFSIVVTAVAIELADFLVEGVEVRGWGWALLLAVIVAGTNLMVEVLVS